MPPSNQTIYEVKYLLSNPFIIPVSQHLVLYLKFKKKMFIKILLNS